MAYSINGSFLWLYIWEYEPHTRTRIRIEASFGSLQLQDGVCYFFWSNWDFSLLVYNVNWHITQWTILLHLLSSGIILRMDLILSLTAVNTANSFPLHMMETNPGPTILIISRAKSEAAHNLGARVILNNQSFDTCIYIYTYVYI